MVNPEDHDARERSELGLPRQLEVTRNVLPDPALGGSRGYLVHQRLQEIVRAAGGDHTVSTRASQYRWKARMAPFRMTGNAQRKALVGRDQFLLNYFMFMYPDAGGVEVAL